MSGRLFLGVDGGGTKTRFVLTRGGDHVVAQHRLGSSYVPQIGLTGLRELLSEGVAEVTGAASIRTSEISYAFFGIPVYGEDSAATAAFDELPAGILGHDRYACDNDMVCGWAGAFAGRDGINVVAGTGSIGYGRRGKHSARAGGWGELFSDEGSAYWIAMQGLNVFTRMSDGRQAKGPLYELTRNAFGLSNDLDLCARTLGDNACSRDTLAGHARVVVDAAREGDTAALEILDRAGSELAMIADAIRAALGFAEGERVPVSWSGGGFNAGELLLRPFRDALHAACPAFEPCAPLFPPDIGAALYAEKLFNGS
jgi:N-acetylglucosamine kinase-like BadF-type ATPase